MRSSSVALSDYLAANDSVVIADLYTFALASGETLRYSGWTGALSVPSAGFPAGSLNYGAAQTFALGPRFGRSKVTNKIGVQPAELDITIMAGIDDLIGTFPIAEAALLGLLDGATVELDRLFAPPQAAGSSALDTSLGCLLWFYGRVADCDIGRSKISMKVKSLMNLLALQQMPRRLYGAGCTHIFGDAMCGYNRVLGQNALGAATGVGQVTMIAASGYQTTIVCTAAVPAGYIEGSVIGATGQNSGYTRTIGNVAGSDLYLLKPFLFPVQAGDTFNILPGCPHTTTACSGTFDNLLRFGGFPFIPPPEYAF